MVQPFKIKVTRFGRQKIGGEFGYVFLLGTAAILFITIGLPNFLLETLIDVKYFDVTYSDLLKLAFIPLGVIVGRHIFYFGQTGELIFTDKGVTIKDGDKEVFKAWDEHKISIYLDGYILQKVNGRKREGNRNYIEIASVTGVEKHFFQVFGKIQMDFLISQLKENQRPFRLSWAA